MVTVIDAANFLSQFRDADTLAETLRCTPRRQRLPVSQFLL